MGDSSYKDIPELRRAVAEASADSVERNLAFLVEHWEPFGSPIEERMFLGLATAAQRDRRNVELAASIDRVHTWKLVSPSRSPYGAWADKKDKTPPLAMRVGFTHAGGAPFLRIYSQCRVRSYRADFVVEWGDCELEPESPTTRRAAVECDGHDFHERTKKQAAHDRKRDRQFQELGLPVLRFTGSEIFANAIGCGEQVLLFFKKLSWREEHGTEYDDDMERLGLTKNGKRVR